MVDKERLFPLVTIMAGKMCFIKITLFLRFQKIRFLCKRFKSQYTNSMCKGQTVGHGPPDRPRAHAYDDEHYIYLYTRNNIFVS